MEDPKCVSTYVHSAGEYNIAASHNLIHKVLHRLIGLHRNSDFLINNWSRQLKRKCYWLINLLIKQLTKLTCH